MDNITITTAAACSSFFTWTALLTTTIALLLPIVVYYSFGRRYDRVRPPAFLIEEDDVDNNDDKGLFEVEEQMNDKALSDEEAMLQTKDHLSGVFLSSIKLFGFMDKSVVELLAGHLEEQVYEEGQIFLEKPVEAKECRFDRSFYVVVEGKVELTVSMRSNLDSVCHVVGPGGTVSSLFSIISIFAEHSNGSRLLEDPDDTFLINEKAAVFVAKTLCRSKVIVIPEQAFHHLATQFPLAAAHITNVVLTRFQRVTFSSLYKFFGVNSELAAMESIINIDKTCPQIQSLTESVLVSVVQSVLKSLEFEEWDAEDVAVFASQHVELKQFDANEVIVKTGTRNNRLLYIVSGLIEGKFSQDATIIYSKSHGLCNSMTAFLNHSSFLDIVVKEKSIVAVISRTGIQLLLQRDPCVMFRLARRLLFRLSPLIRTVDLLLDWSHVNAGKCLVKTGDPIQGIYIVLNGKLRNVTKKFEYEQGDVIGTTSLLLDGAQHYSTVIAVRDCELACMPKSLFDQLIKSIPSLALTMSRTLAARQTGLPSSTTASTKAVALIPGHSKVPIREFANRLRDEMATTTTGPCTLITSADVIEALGKDAFAPIGNLKLTEWLYEQEEVNRVVLLQGDMIPASMWTKRCIRQADCVLIVVDAVTDHPGIGSIERSFLKYFKKDNALGARIELVFLHGQKVCKPKSTIRWLKCRPWLSAHHHIFMSEVGGGYDYSTNQDVLDFRDVLLPAPVRRRLDKPVPRASTAPSDDFGRLSRLLMNKAIGVVLSGGGARGVAHVGVLRALCEAGIPIDVIGGTSMGAFVAGLYASNADWLTLPSRIRYFCERASSRWRQLGDLTWPYCSWFTGHSLNRALWKLFGEWMIDDLWIPFYCVTTDISVSRKAVHKSYSLCDDYIWRYVRASMSLSGLVPPVCDRFGHMHVDGGYVSTVPMEVMQDEFQGRVDRVIVIDVSASYNDPGRYKIGDAVSGSIPAIKRLLGGGDSPSIPSLEEIQTRIAFVSSDASSSTVRNAPGTLIIKPQVHQINILDFCKYQEIMRIGYEEGQRSIEGWIKAGVDVFPSSAAPHPHKSRRRSF